MQYYEYGLEITTIKYLNKKLKNIVTHCHCDWWH